MSFPTILFIIVSISLCTGCLSNSSDNDKENTKKTQLLEDAFLKAVLENDLKATEKYLKNGINPNKTYDKNGWLALSLASLPNIYLLPNGALGSPEMVKLLLDYGADPNAISKGVLPLACAAGCNSMDIVQMLIDKGADVNGAYENKSTALMSAVRHIDMVKFLVKSGADLNKQDINGNSALIIAVLTPLSYDTVKFLLEQGASTNLLNKKGVTALDCVLKSMEKDYGHSEENKQRLIGVINLLKKYGAKTSSEMGVGVGVQREDKNGGLKKDDGK